MNVEDQLPGTPGTYALLLHLSREAHLSVGSLGEHRFPVGYFLYIGSAQGPGGLRARVKRHLRPEGQKRLHWHIDRLMPGTRILEVWWHIGSPSIECSWAKAIAEIGILSPPRFGASDCRCPGHLIYVGEKQLENPAWNSSKKLTQGAIDRVELSPV